eukprot:TRINITY_DN801_c0_g1_i1.p2 TRINITY_DN801_c0_g1~~TRINITY_DN801_c0_g1_i1.p2  ORF type:complete len:100 (+),score=23.09 TRINITY_DN801_c0_g1_i1:386-685(+)
MSTTNKPTAPTAEIQRVKLQLGDEVFYVYAEPGKADLFKKNPSMPLTDVVEVFDIFQNLYDKRRPSHDFLQEKFGTTDSDSIIKKILLEGEIEGKRHSA